MEQMTVKKLRDLCTEQIRKGNGNKAIVISDDNEGNGFHGLFMGFSQMDEYFYGLTSDSHFTDSDKEAHDNLIILG